MIKRFASLMAIFMAFSFAFNPSLAEAKKFGGGKSFGKSFKTAPAPKQPSAAPSTTGKQQAAKPGSSKKGLLGGLLGGLLAGGLIAALFGGAFEGLQMMDMLLMAGLAFVLFKVFKSMAQKRAMAAAHGPMAGHGAQQNPMQQMFGQQQNDSVQQRQDMGFDAVQTPAQSQGGFGASDVPMNLPAGFDLNGFMNGARDHYRTLQEAWNTGDLEKIREYVAPELFAELKAERETLSGDQHTEVMFVDAELGRADHNGQLAEISVRFTGKYRDTVEGVEEDITDIWHLQRDLSQGNAPWLIIGIEG